MRRNIMMPGFVWVVLGLLAVLALLSPFLVVLVARADEGVGRPMAEGFVQPSAQGKLGPFPAMKPEIENVYIQQSLRAIEILGWSRGEDEDTYFDWRMGMEYTFRPWDWDSSVWRSAWAKTPGERFARWWVGYCVINCEACQGEGCNEIEGELASDFDEALARVTAR